MRILDFLFGKVETTHFLSMKNAAKWERIGSYSVRFQNFHPENVYCGACKMFASVPEHEEKGLCRRYDSKNVVVFTRSTDYCMYFMKKTKQPIRLQRSRFSRLGSELKRHHIAA
jgi:hypothetical protein